MSTDSTTETTARDLYHEIEADLLATIDVTAFLARALDAVSDLDAVNELAGAAHVLAQVRERLDLIMAKCLNVIGPS